MSKKGRRAGRVKESYESRLNSLCRQFEQNYKSKNHCNLDRVFQVYEHANTLGAPSTHWFLSSSDNFQFPFNIDAGLIDATEPNLMQIPTRDML